ncbi:GGDEF domain-containing protein [Vibrio sp. JC009]|uniref:GGDEF domain-containing protein n=1 Tax=Vibrio sp. JC009 TaxID=2912314 RepID=UPI0023B0410F|nr:diguanylate cyclase [Vibrio sp. JC009]WED24247.1 GGDEF domain-containing protein [Vibrio sp. JC009]
MENNIGSIAERRLAKFLKYVCIGPMLIFPPVIVLNCIKGAYLLAGVEVAMLIIFALFLFFISKPDFLIPRLKLLNVAAITIMSAIVVLHVSALFLPTHNTIFSHSALVIMLSFLILGRRRGTPVAILVTVAALSASTYKYANGISELSISALANIFILVIITFVVSYFNESTRAEYEAALLEKNKELELLSKTDGLTQLFNRRYFDQNLANEWSRLQRNELPLSVILCDIDHFKLFNDSGGHLAGDHCIQQIALCLKSLGRRSSDIVARYGGEEFVILLPQTGSEDAQQLAGKIMEGIGELAIPHPAYRGKPVTISVGVSTIIPSQELSPDSIVSLADKALYESKNKGKNRITVKNQLDFFHATT